MVVALAMIDGYEHRMHFYCQLLLLLSKGAFLCRFTLHLILHFTRGFPISELRDGFNCRQRITSEAYLQ